MMVFKKYLKRLYLYSVQSLGFSRYLLVLATNIFKLARPIKKSFKGTISVLANGPSLKEVIPSLTTDVDFLENDFIVMNFFAFDEVFPKIKPKHYCFADPMFFQETHNSDSVKRVFDTLNNSVDWHMNIYISNSNKHKFIDFSKISNSHIKIVCFNSIRYQGYNSLKYFFYSNSLAAPRIQNVAVLAVFLSINLGYNNIKLYGVDHSFLETLVVDDKNRVCNKDGHFYDKHKPVTKPILKTDSGGLWSMSEYLEAIANMFRGHDDLALYASSRKVIVTNYTKESYIDAYERFQF